MIWWVFMVLALITEAVAARVYYSKQEALELAFGKGAKVQMRPLFLTAEQRSRIERLAKVKLDSSLFTFYVGRREGRVIGYAAIETHTVRTQPETLLIVLDAKGKLRRVEVLAFHEPPEYQPPARWFERLLDVPLQDLRLGSGVEGVSGATLSSRAAVDTVRKVLAVYTVVVAGGQG